MAEISKIDGFDIGIDSQSPQFFKGDKSNILGFDIGVDSMQPQFFNDDSTVKMFGIGTSSYTDSISININFKMQ